MNIVAKPKLKENVACYYCGSWISKGSAQLDHFPRPASRGGTDTVWCCTTCHDMKDRYDLKDWPEEWIRKVMEEIPKLSRETRIFLAKTIRLFAESREPGPPTDREVQIQSRMETIAIANGILPAMEEEE